MASKKNKAGTTNLPALKIGSRVRCTDDGVAGRIVWANAVSVKIKWDDGEQVTWRRDALATRPIEILDADDDQTTTPVETDTAKEVTAATEVDQPVAASDAPEPTAATEPPQTEPETTPPTAEQPQAEPETTLATTEPTPTEPTANATEQPASEPLVVPEATVEQAAPDGANGAAPESAKPKQQRKAPAAPKEKKLSALDAAAKVLAEEGRPMTCKEMIGAMAIKGYWSSPGGKTPDATLYSAILREIDTKGADARFVKTERGRFARKN